MRTLFKRAKTCSNTELRKQRETYLFKMFEKYGYAKKFVRRTVHATNKEISRKGQSNGLLSYISEMYLN